LQRRVQRHHGAIHARAAAAVAQAGVHRVGKVHRRGALGQLDHGRIGRQHIDAVVEQATLGRAPRVAPQASNWRSTAILASYSLVADTPA
jgi:hypothetical protein